MNPAHQPPSPPPSCSDTETVTRLLLLPDGRVLAHNLTPWMAEILRRLAPGDLILEQRQAASRRTTAQKPALPEATIP